VSPFRAEKVLALPSALEPSTFYAVKAGSGFRLYLTTSDGAEALPMITQSAMGADVAASMVIPAAHGAP
jgi:hypothetical protein